MMQYQEAQPSLALRPYIKCIWSLKGSAADAAMYGEQLLFPNESSEVVFNFADCFPDTLRRPEGSTPAYFIGPLTHAGKAYFQGETNLLGVTFQPGMASLFTQHSIADLRDTVTPLTHAWESLAQRYEQLHEASTLLEKVKIVERECIKRANAHLNTEAVKMSERFRLLSSPEQNGVRTVRELCDSLQLSERTLERVFPTHLGLHPKEYLRIQRVNEVSKMLLVEGKEFLQVACENEFTDYSHLYKELKKFGLENLISKEFSSAEFVCAYLAA